MGAACVRAAAVTAGSRAGASDYGRNSGWGAAAGAAGARERGGSALDVDVDVGVVVASVSGAGFGCERWRAWVGDGWWVRWRAGGVVFFLDLACL